MGKKRSFTGHYHDLYLACCLGLIFFVAGCHQWVPKPVPQVADPGIEACLHTGRFREMVDRGAFQQARRENNRVRSCLDRLSGNDPLSTALLKQEVEIYGTLLDGILARDKRNRELSQFMDSLAKAAKNLQEKIKDMENAREKARVQFRGVEKENARLKQQIESYKAIDLGLGTLNSKPGDTVGK